MLEALFAPRTPQDLEKWSRQLQVETISQLNNQQSWAAISKWTATQMTVYRLLVEPAASILPAFDQDHRSECPVCHPSAGNTQRLDDIATAAFIQQSCPLSLHKSSESDLACLPHGSFWVALARACRLQISPSYAVCSRPTITNGDRGPFGGPLAPIRGFLSASRIPRSSDFGLENEDVDEDQPEDQRSWTDEVTVHLMITFMQQSLHACLFQDLKTVQEVRARIERTRTTTTVKGTTKLIAEDDGGVRLMVLRRGSVWTAQDASLALIEAKRTFKVVQDGDESQISSTVANNMLAQCFREAFVAWNAKREVLGQDVFLIIGAGTCIRFMHFRFGSDYAEYIDAPNATAEVALLADKNKDTCVHLQSSQWFNLQSRDGRRKALCHLLALLRWHDSNDATDVDIDM
ncbi:hypothetical protein ANO11243_076730 [Dothideomycetidae sp. 11243]|nr:hypothetical protein ANO11243_076730 [fungal sp. No.11243]